MSKKITLRQIALWGLDVPRGTSTRNFIVEWIRTVITGFSSNFNTPTKSKIFMRFFFFVFPVYNEILRQQIYQVISQLNQPVNRLFFCLFRKIRRRQISLYFCQCLRIPTLWVKFQEPHPFLITRTVMLALGQTFA